MYRSTKGTVFSSLAVKMLLATAVLSLSVLVLTVPQAKVFADGEDFSLDWGGADFSGFDNSYSYDTFTPDASSYSYDTFTPDESSYSYDTFTQDEYSYDSYSYDTFTPDYSTPSYGGGGYGGGSSFGGGSSYHPTTPSYPSYPTTPRTFTAPTYIPPQTYPPVIHPVPQPMPQPVTNNNCVNNSCNNNYVDNSVTRIDNSINNSGNVATVTNVNTQPVQYPVQYVQPVYQQPVYQQPVYQQPQPYCSITISNSNNYAYGQNSNQLVTLTWSSNYATSAYISPNVGSVSSYGSMTVYPVNNQMYTMTVYGQGGTATCSTPVHYAAPIVYNNPTPTPYVSLSQIPYTGLDFGPLGNALYWLSLVSFAGAAAYLVLYFKGGVLAFGGMNKRSNYAVAMPKIQMPVASTPVVRAVVVEEKKAELVLSPIQPTPIALPVATMHKSTIDSMNVKFSKAGEAPRIIITRQ